MLKVAPLMLLLLAAGGALGDRDLSQYTPGRPIFNTRPGIRPLAGRRFRRSPENHRDTRPANRPFISPVPPPGHQPVQTLPALVPGRTPVQTLPAELPERREGDLPSPSSLTRPSNRPPHTRPRVSPVPPQGNVPVQTLPEKLPEGQEGELPPPSELTRPFQRPPHTKPAQGNVPVQTLPAELPDARTSELSHKQTRPVVRPAQDRPQISPQPPKDVPVQPLPATVA